ncbi:IRR1 [Candida theae]|uniref:IRR1 n=1 Tax=Candida theae TaxID=1198502 RepID=A0AAD5BI98_9ASCO|nr:IRR1 [Candida theae]KAI5964010.1 IRR1 [Candida theae]
MPAASTATTSRRSARSANRRTVHYEEFSDEEQEDQLEAYSPSSENTPNHTTNSTSTKRKKTTNSKQTSSKRQKTVSRDQLQQQQQQQQQQQKSKRKQCGKGKKKQPQLEDDWEENYLYQALSSPEINVTDLAQEWIETYEEEAVSDNTHSLAITLVINLILRSCGSFHLFQPHDLINLASTAVTVEEITLAFGNQSTHKFAFKLVPVFKKNVLQFFQNIIEICHEKGLLYPPYTQGSNDADYDEDDYDAASESSQLMALLLTWVTSLTRSAIRALRYTSTEISMAMQLALSKIGKSVTANLSRSRKHLGRLNDERSTKYKTIRSTITNYESQLNTLNGYFDDIASTVVSQRYKDFDPQIRLIVVKYLIDTMSAYPSYFCQSQFLKYFGWLLSDPINQVRSEISRDLLKLYKMNKNQDIVDGLTQFSIKFKPQFILMCEVDIDTNVRTNCCGILTEMVKMGFLDAKDKHEVIKAFPFTATKLKLQHDFVRFVQVATDENAIQVMEKNQSIFERDSYVLHDHDARQLLKIKVMLEELSFLVEKDAPLEKIFESELMTSVYAPNLRSLLDYLLTDNAELRVIKDGDVDGDEEVEEEEKEKDSDLNQVKMLVQLDDVQKLTLLKTIHGLIKASIVKLKGKQAGASKAEEEEIRSTIITQFIDYIPKLQSFCFKANNRFKIFVRIWQDLIDDKHNCIFNYYIKLDKVEEYELAIKEILQYFYEFSMVDEFQPFFEKLFSSRGLTESIKFEVQRIVNALVENTTVYLRDSQEEEEERVEDDNDNDDPEKQKLQEREELADSSIDMDRDIVIWTNRQKHVIKLCREVSILVQKIILVGNYVNIANLDKIDDLIYQFNNRILNKFDLNVVLNEWKHDFILQLPKFTNALVSVIELVFIISGWKFEKMIDTAPQDQHQFDVELEFEMVGDVVSNLIRYIDELKDLNTATEDTSVEDLDKLVEFKCQLINQYINLVISFRLFYVKFQDDNQFKHFKLFFRSNKPVIMIKRDLQMELLEMFLIKEMKLAHLLGIELDRDDEEGVHYEDYVEKQVQVGQVEENEDAEDGENEEVDVDEDVDEEERRRRCETRRRSLRANKEQLKQVKIWDLEKDLSVYTLKLISLVKMQLVSQDIYQRLKKNAGKLGEVFYKVIEQEKVVSEGGDRQEEEIPVDATDGNESVNLSVDVGDGAEAETSHERNENQAEDGDAEGDQVQDVSMDLQLELDV